jgi:hypothetical protein
MNRPLYESEGTLLPAAEGDEPSLVSHSRERPWLWKKVGRTPPVLYALGSGLEPG